MYSRHSDFIRDLRDGKESALRRFYERMAAAKSDEEFWKYLCSLTEGREEEISQLRNSVDPRGFDWFMKNAPLHLLMVFLFAALSFAACDTGAPVVVPTVSPSKQETAPSLIENKPITVDDAPTVTMPPPPSAEQLRESLVVFINKAELPASEKKRLLNIVKKTAESKLVDTEADLSALFQKSNPKEIAEALEAMVMFKRIERKWEPSFGALYKGVSFC